MNIYTAQINKHDYHIKLICIAENINMAQILINNELKSNSFTDIQKKDIKQQDTSTRRVEVLYRDNKSDFILCNNCIHYDTVCSACMNSESPICGSFIGGAFSCVLSEGIIK